MRHDVPLFDVKDQTQAASTDLEILQQSKAMAQVQHFHQ